MNPWRAIGIVVLSSIASAALLTSIVYVGVSYYIRHGCFFFHDWKFFRFTSMNLIDVEVKCARCGKTKRADAYIA